MVRRLRMFFVIGMVLGIVHPVLADGWAIETMPMSADCPSIAMMGGTMPVVCDGNITKLLSPNGWQPMNLSGFIAGDGGSRIVANENPVKLGLDGQFYSTLQDGSGCQAVKLGPAGWESVDVSLSGTSGLGVSLADAEERAYLACQDRLAMQQEAGQAELTWSGQTITDLAVSQVGEVAFSCDSSSQQVELKWFDYKFCDWRTQPFSTSSNFEKMAIEFDMQGNLCVAYVNPLSELRYAVFDFETDEWQNQFVAEISGNCYATALTFDGNDQPVIVAGNVLAHHGLTVIPGDANCDGMVDVGDLGILAGHYGQINGACWLDGDFNGDGSVDVGDLGILAGHYGQNSTVGTVGVPEPGMLVLLLAGLGVLRRLFR